MKLTDEQIVFLAEAGMDSNITAQDVLSAKRRIELKTKLPSILGEDPDSPVYNLFSRVLVIWGTTFEARRSQDYIGQCAICRKVSTFDTYKTGRNKGKPKPGTGTFVWGYDLTASSVRVLIGGKTYSENAVCTDCYDAIKDRLIKVLVELDIQADWTIIDKSCPYKLDVGRECYSCHEPIWESEMGRSMTFFGDGTYPSTCPKCKAVSEPFGPSHKITGTRRVIRKGE